MFQVESRAQMSCLPRMKPVRFYDIVVQVAIIRPGPIVGKMVHPYLNRRQGREAVDCLHPSLEPVLRRTLGVPLFQEQLLRMAMIAAGFSGGEAEELRRAMGFKRSEKRMQEIEVKLRAGMARNGITGKSRRTSSAPSRRSRFTDFPNRMPRVSLLLAYASAWLKCHRLAAFTCAMLNNQPMGFYAPADPDQRCAAPRLAGLAGRRDAIGVAVYARTRPASRPPLCARTPRADRPGHPARSRRTPVHQRGRSRRPRPRTAQGRTQSPRRNRRSQSARQTAPPRRALAIAARHPSRWPAARASGRDGRAFAAGRYG